MQFSHLISHANKKGHSIEWPCIHDGGDEGDRTPDLLTASQALSQLSYAPVTRRYYKGRSSGMQEVFWVDSHTYGFSWDRAELTDFDFGKISQLTHRPDKTLTRRCLTCRGRRSRRLGGLGSWPFSGRHQRCPYRPRGLGGCDLAPTLDRVRLPWCWERWR